VDTNDPVYITSCALLAERFGVPADAIRPDATFEELGMDSLALAEFAFVLRDEFAVLLQRSEVTKRNSVADVARLIQEQLSAASTAP
jgi:acyl carrier protein